MLLGIITIDNNHCFKKNEQIIYKELDEGPVLIDPYRRTLTSLNATALEIWRSLDGKNSVTDIIDILKTMFDIGERETEKDVRAFLKALIDREMIR